MRAGEPTAARSRPQRLRLLLPNAVAGHRVRGRRHLLERRALRIELEALAILQPQLGARLGRPAEVLSKPMGAIIKVEEAGAILLEDEHVIGPQLGVAHCLAPPLPKEFSRDRRGLTRQQAELVLSFAGPRRWRKKWPRDVFITSLNCL